MTAGAPARRLIAVLLAALTLVAGAPFLSGVAHASHSVGTVSPNASQNNTSLTLTVNGVGFVVSPGPVTALNGVFMRRVNNPSDVINGTVTSVSPTGTSLAASFNLTLANPGAYDVVVRQAGEDKVCNPSSCFTITRNQVPVVTDVQRDTSDGAELGDLIIRGLGFTKDATIRFLIPGTTNVDPGLAFVRDNDGTQDSTTIRGRYSVVGGFTPGLHDVGLVDPDSNVIVATCSNCFKQPRLDTIVPASGGQGSTNRDFAITGDGLVGSTLTLSPSSGITFVSQSTQSEQAMSLRLTIASNAATGQRTLTAVHPDGGYWSKPSALQITARPVVDSLDRAALGQGAKNVTVTATGSGFQPGVTFSIAGLQITDVQRLNPTTATFKVSIPAGTPIGPRDLVVTNLDGGRSTLSPGITVTTGPTVTQVDPPSANQGATGQVISIKGSGFNLTGGVTVTFGEPGGITVNTVTVTSSDTITATISVAPGASGGLRTVTVRNNSDEGQGTCAAPGCFGVNTITSVSPTALNNTPGLQSITITKPGGGLGSTSQVQLIRNGAQPGETPILGTYVKDENGGTKLTVNVELYLAGPGSYNIQVTTGDVIDSCTQCFTVTGSTPTVSSIDPDAGSRGTGALPFSVIGSNFSKGGRLIFKTGPSASFPNATAIRVVPGSYVAQSPSLVQAALQIDNDATGTYYLFYDDDSTGTAAAPVTCASTTSCAFAIVDPPSFRSSNPVSPNKRGQNATAATITVVGDEFDNETTFDFGDGVVVIPNSYNRSGVNTTPGADDTITVSVTVDRDAEVGVRTVTATTSSGSATCSACFEVTPAPSITSITPGSGKRSQAVNVTISGSGFQPGLTNSSVFAGPEITVSNVAFVNDTTVTARFTISSTAAFGGKDVSVQNADGGLGTGLDAFRVIDVPTAPGTPVATAGDKQATLVWTAPSSNGGGPITGYTITCTPACPSVSTPGGVTNATVPGLQNGTTYRFQVRASNEAGAGPASALSNAVTPLGPEGEFVPVTPYRVLDTRRPGGGGRFGAFETRVLQIAGTGGTASTPAIPATGVSAVVLNVTAVNPTNTGNLRVYPADGSVPGTATVGYLPREIVPNLTKVKVAESGSNTGAVKVLNSAGTVDVLVDVVGYFSDGRQGSPEGDELIGTAPERIVDTRDGTATLDAPLGAFETRTFDIADGSPVADEASAVVVNLTVTKPTAGGFISLYPASEASRPSVSNINFVAGQTVANLAVVKLGEGGVNDGKLKVFTGISAPGRSVEMFLDVVGYYLDTTTGTKFKGLSPTRAYNTKSAPPLGGVTTLQAGQIKDFTLLGVGGVPDLASVKSVVISVQAVVPQGSGYLRVWPSGEASPNTSVVNFPPKRTTLNLVVAKVGANGKISIYNGSGGATDVVIDVVGYYIDQA